MLHTGYSIQPRIRDEHLNLYLWLLLTATNLVDLLASRRAFAFGLEELNPFIDAVLAGYGIWAVGLMKAFWLFVLWLLLPRVRGWTQTLLAFATLVYFALTLLHLWYLSPLI